MIIAIVTARANSKELPRKNMLDLGGKPLIQHTFDVAIKSKVFDKIILSSDFDEAIELAKTYEEIDVPFRRPKHLCIDNASQLDVINHVLSYLSEVNIPATHLVLLQPTAPFRTIAELQQGVKLLELGSQSVIGVTPVMHHPADYLVLDREQKIKYLMPQYITKPRQFFPLVYFNNGAFYGFEIGFFKLKQVFYDEDSTLLVMGQKSLIDIDSEFDLRLANGIFE